MLRFAVAGNPNSGKTSLFNDLTGALQHVGNYPGVTVELVEGESRFLNETVSIIDLPGTYSLTAYSKDEIVARDFIMNENPDLIINVVDASNLERNLYLTVQLIELGKPMVIALNMMDIAEKKGLSLNIKRFSELLGIPAIPTIASKYIGIEELKAACIDSVNKKILPKQLEYSHELSEALGNLEKILTSCQGFSEKYPQEWFALKMLENDEPIIRKIEQHKDKNSIYKVLADSKKNIETHSGEDSATAVIEARHAIATGIAKDVISMNENVKRLYTEKIDAVVCNRFLGPIILCLVVYLLFVCVFQISDQLTWIPLFNGKWVSPVGLFSLFFESLGEQAENHIGNQMLLSLVKNALVEGVGSVMGFVPLIFFMFLFIAALEDTGYVARIAFIMDRILRAFGLQGKSILAMIISGGLGGGGCAVPGIMAARTLREEKDRLITILVAPMMNCGAKMPVYAMLIAAFFSKAGGAMMLLLWALSWFFALMSGFILRKTLIKGEQTPFVMELPVYHVPTYKGLLIHTWNRTWLYIKKAGTIILAINIVMWALMYFPEPDSTKYDSEISAKQNDFINRLKEHKYGSVIRSREDIALIDSIFSKYKKLKVATDRKTQSEIDQIEKESPLLAEFAKSIANNENNESPVEKLYSALKKHEKTLNAEKNRERLLNSYAGQTGANLNFITKYAGFDWIDNIALMGGFAAKELVLGILSTAYAMDTNPQDNPSSISTQIAQNKSWSPLKAFSLMIFVMLYAPCIPAVVTIGKETGSWKWAIFSVFYSTLFALTVSTFIYQIGHAIAY